MVNELYHHGVKGQKHGVKNGPPYPLGSDISTGKRLKSKIIQKHHERTVEKAIASQHYLNIYSREMSNIGEKLYSRNVKKGKEALDKLKKMGIDHTTYTNVLTNNPYSLYSYYGKKGLQRPMLFGDKGYNKIQLDDSVTGKINDVDIKTLKNKLLDNITTNKYRSYADANIKIGEHDYNVFVRLNEGSTIKNINDASKFVKKIDNDSIVNKLTDKFYTNGSKEWIDKNEISKKDFIKKLKPDSIACDPKRKSYTVYYLDGGTYDGHLFCIEGDMRSGRINDIYLAG